MKKIGLCSLALVSIVLFQPSMGGDLPTNGSRIDHRQEYALEGSDRAFYKDVIDSTYPFVNRAADIFSGVGSLIAYHSYRSPMIARVSLGFNLITLAPRILFNRKDGYLNESTLTAHYLATGCSLGYYLLSQARHFPDAIFDEIRPEKYLRRGNIVFNTVAPFFVCYVAVGITTKWLDFLNN